jgi:hypothetical protein
VCYKEKGVENMEECKHEHTETFSYPQEYYGHWTLVTEIKCVDCGEILDEKVTDF